MIICFDFYWDYEVQPALYNLTNNQIEQRKELTRQYIGIKRERHDTFIPYAWIQDGESFKSSITSFVVEIICN